jgi:hypothetical protein
MDWLGERVMRGACRPVGAAEKVGRAVPAAV